MQTRPLSRAEVRGIDARAAEGLGLPTLVLMENAGRGAAALLARSPRRGAGGDRLRRGQQRRRRRRGRPPPRRLGVCGPGRLVRPPERLSGDAAVQFQILEKSGLDPQTWEGAIEPQRLDALFRGADWVVDGLLGTGPTRPVEGPMRG
jgi:NAD(P)H-hydrate epimerase